MAVSVCVQGLKLLPCTLLAEIQLNKFLSTTVATLTLISYMQTISLGKWLTSPIMQVTRAWESVIKVQIGFSAIRI